MPRLVGLLLVMLLAGCGGSVSAQPDPCDVVTKEEVAAIIEAKPGKAFPTGTGEGCSFGNRRNEDATTLLVNVVPGDTPSKFADDRDAAGKAAPLIEAGVGDESFSYGTARVQSAEARKGSFRVRVLIEGPKATPAKARQALRSAVARTP